MEDAAAGDEQMLPTSAVGVRETTTQKHSGKLEREDDCFSVATIVMKVCGGANDGMIEHRLNPLLPARLPLQGRYLSRTSTAVTS